MSSWIDVSSVTPRIAYVATAAQTDFPVPFVFFSDDDLVVYQNDELLELTTDYTVTGEEDEDGGTVTLLVGATVGDEINISRDVPIEQTTHIPPSGPLDIAGLNLQFSRLIAIAQQINDKLERTIRLPESEATTDQRLPALADRASKYAAWNADGDLIGAAGALPADIVVSTYMEPALAAITPTQFFGNFFADAAAFLDLYGTWTQFGTRAEAAAETVSTSISLIAIAGYTTRGDAPIAWYVRTASEPSHSGKIQTADGGWWVITGDEIWPEQFGAVGDSVTDDMAAIQAAETCRAALKCELRFASKGYYMSNPNNWEVNRPRWRGADHNSSVLIMDGTSGVCIWLKGASGNTSGYMRDMCLWCPATRTTGVALLLDGDATFQPDEFASHHLKITGAGSWNIPIWHNGADRASPLGLRLVTHYDLFIGRDTAAGIYANCTVGLQIFGGGIFGGTVNTLQLSGDVAAGKGNADCHVNGLKINGALTIDDTTSSVFNVICGSVFTGSDADDNTIMGFNSGATANNGSGNNLAALG